MTMPDVVIVRYGEIWLKSRPVRNRFERLLVRNIRSCLSEQEVPYESIVRSRGRIYVYSKDIGSVLGVVAKVSGVVSASPARRITAEIESMKSAALEQYKKGSFRITARRQTKDFPFNSQQICEVIGQHVREKTGAKVDLSKPDVEISIEIGDKDAFVFSETVAGPGGLPVGAQGKVLCLVSDEDSILAASEMMRRGCSVHLLHFGKVKEAEQLKQRLGEKMCTGKIEFSISGAQPDRRSMYDAAEGFAKEIGAYAIVSGETRRDVIASLQKGDVLLLFPLLGQTNRIKSS
jgi:thiamine biosynthesis protein ThiI